MYILFSMIFHQLIIIYHYLYLIYLLFVNVIALLILILLLILLFDIFYSVILYRFLIIFYRLKECRRVFSSIGILGIIRIFMLKHIIRYLLIKNLILFHSSCYLHLFSSFVGILLLIYQDFKFFLFIF